MLKIWYVIYIYLKMDGIRQCKLVFKFQTYPSLLMLLIFIEGSRYTHISYNIMFLQRLNTLKYKYNVTYNTWDFQSIQLNASQDVDWYVSIIHITNIIIVKPVFILFHRYNIFGFKWHINMLRTRTEHQIQQDICDTLYTEYNRFSINKIL